MTKISLRAYNNEIDGVIDKDKTQEAIDHCKYILKLFPKHVDTYRLLAKAYLEEQRHSEALDILQRLLSVIPDDFISEIGMSVIREDEHNLDAAIWHMERAFEVQPSHATIQDELKRLYIKRDGVDPQKSRLTRGALIRMYIRGELHSQAITEIKAALADDPLRSDLEVLLARMYYQMGQLENAEEVCSRILSKLPYCYEANLLLVDILSSKGQSERANPYRQILQSLDPYYNFVGPSALTSSQVPDNAVMVEKLQWQPSQERTEKPAWASTIGVTFDKDQGEKEKNQEWLSLDNMPEEVSPVLQEPISEAHETVESQNMTPVEETHTPEDVIPDWLKEAGWSESNGTTSEKPFVEEEAEVEESGPVTADIPEWLKSMEPTVEAVENIEDSAKGGVEQEKLDWLDNPLTSQPSEVSDETHIKEAEKMNPSQEHPGDQPAPKIGDTQPIKISSQSTGAADIKPAAPVSDTGKTTTPEGPGAGSDADLAWLESLAARQGADENTLLTTPEQREAASIRSDQTISEQLVVSPEQPAQILSDQMKTPIEQPAQASPALESVELPEWLKEAPQSTPEDIIPTADKISSISEQPSQQEEKQVETPSQKAPSEEMDLDASFAWLETLAARQGADEATLLTHPEERLEETPEWLSQQTGIETPEMVVPPETPASSAETPIIAAKEEAIAPTTPAEEGTIPEWLLESDKQGIITPSEQTTLPVEKGIAEIPIEEEQHGAMPEQEIPVITAEEPVSIIQEQPEQVSEEQQLPDWLIEKEEILKSEHAAADQTIISTEPPVQEPGKIIPEISVPPVITGATTEEGLPAWLSEPETTTPESTVEAVPETIAETPLPDWLKEIHDENPVFTEAPMPIEQPSLEPAVLDQTNIISTVSESPEISEELAQPIESTISEVEAASIPPLPDWLQDIHEENPVFTDEPITPEPGLPEWIQGAPEPTSATAEVPIPSSQIEIQPVVPEKDMGWVSVPEPTTPVVESETSAPEALAEVQQEIKIPEIPPSEELVEANVEEPPQPPVVPTEAEAVVQLTPEKEPVYQQAKIELSKGNLKSAIEQYTQLIQKGSSLNDIIFDLEEALPKFPVDIDVWQTLGDAYARADRVQEALDAYTKAEDLLD